MPENHRKTEYKKLKKASNTFWVCFRMVLVSRVLTKKYIILIYHFPIATSVSKSEKRGKRKFFYYEKWLRLGSFGPRLWALRLSHNNKQGLIWFPWNCPNKFWPKRPIFRPISCKKSLKTKKFLEKNRLFQDLTLDYL